MLILCFHLLHLLVEEVHCINGSVLCPTLSFDLIGVHQDKELGRKSSKPPVVKIRGGLDLNQHELSAIQEVESPTSGRTSILGKKLV